MNVIAILGSRNSSGQTARACQALLEGAASGSTSEEIFLPRIRIERCRQCDENGWGACRSEGRCVIDDDFASVVEKLKAAERVVFANPVYFGDLSESLRAFLDRLRRISLHVNGKAGIAGKPAVGICVAGGGGGGAPSCAWSLEKVLNTCGFDVVDMIPARRQNLDMKCEILKHVGRWFAGVAAKP